MAAPSVWYFATTARTNILSGNIKTGNAWNVALFTSSWVTTTTAYSTTNEVAPNYGYTQGGLTLGTKAVAGTTSVTVKFPASIVSTWNVSGGSVVTRIVVLYDTVATGDNIVAWAYFDSTPADITVTTGNSLTVGTTSATIFTLA